MSILENYTRTSPTYKLRELIGKKVIINKELKGTVIDVTGEFIVIKTEDNRTVYRFRRGITSIEVIQ
jgi:hypothetical protein